MMKLSEAIRLGAMLRPRQSFGCQYDAAHDATCALGAAADAIGILDTSVPNGYLGCAPEDWAWVQSPTKCPQCRRSMDRADRAIIHLNNYHRWSRERIARWVARRERVVDRRADALAAAAPEAP